MQIHIFKTIKSLKKTLFFSHIKYCTPDILYERTKRIIFENEAKMKKNEAKMIRSCLNLHRDFLNISNIFV